MSVVTLKPGNTRLLDWALEEMRYQDGSKPADPFDLSVESESRNAGERDFSTQIYWMFDRLLVLDAQREIVGQTFDFKEKNVAEFGSGAYGWFYNFLLSERKKFRQFDINPEIVKNNKKFSRKQFFRFPKVDVGNMYDMPLESNSLDVILGFSSWDSIYFLQRSAEEVKRVLKPGGHFVHLQDISPADGPYLLMEAKKRQERELSTTFPVRFLYEIIPREFGYQKRRHVIGIDSIDWGEVRLGQYLNNCLSDVFQEQGFEIQKMEGIEKEVLVASSDLRSKFEKLTKYSLEGVKNSLGFAYGKFEMTQDDSIPEGQTKQWAYMDVFVAQKT